MPKEIDVARQSTDGLRSLIQNYRRNGLTERRIYIDALAELERRTGKGLDFDRSMAVIREAARGRRFVSYKELADASGAEWSRVRYAMNGHLGRLVEYAHRNNWPMLSAIVVNKDNVATGGMEPETLRGFVTAAKDLGLSVEDEEEFLRDQQRRVFEWGASQPADEPGS